MKSIKLNLGGPNNVSVDWGGSVEGLANAAQKVSVLATTKRGSVRFLPDLGADTLQRLSNLGAYDFLAVQHALNFGALKALKDVAQVDASDEDTVESVQMSLLDVKGSAAEVAIVVTNALGESTNQITEIA